MKLSIITINRNNAEGLRKTMESVLSQTYRDFEYIIIDGASTDDSVKVIKSMVPEQKMNINGIQVRWISEPDTGIYNAMNKGIWVASGEYLLFLNSGDYLVDEFVIDKVIGNLDGTDVIQGSVYVDKVDEKCLNKGYGHSEITFLEIYKGYFWHQATFFKRTLFDEYGMYDERFKIAGDTAFYLKSLGFGNASFKFIDQPIAVFENSGLSAQNNSEGKKLRPHDNKLLQEMYSPRLWQFLQDNSKKIELYDKLHRNRFAWGCVMALVRLFCTSTGRNG